LRQQKIELLPPDVNESGAGFTPLTKAIRYGLEAIKGIGHGSVEAIIAGRADGFYRTIFDFAERVGPKALNKRVFESLVCAGAFDTLNYQKLSCHLWRASISVDIDSALVRGTRVQRDFHHGQTGLFANPMQTIEVIDVGTRRVNVEAWTHLYLLAGEKQSLGFYITGHPLENYHNVLSQLQCYKTSELAGLHSGDRISIGGIITSLQIRTTKKGEQFAVFRIEDREGGVRCILWSDSYNRFKRLIDESSGVLITGRLEISDDAVFTVIVEEVAYLDEVLQCRANSLTISLTPPRYDEGRLSSIWDVLGRYKGECDVYLLEVFQSIYFRFSLL
jgi:DNA polymerase-3 subunit alpha